MKLTDFTFRVVQEFLDDGNGNVSGIRTCKVEWKRDPTGRYTMEKIPGSEKTFKADLVFLAMGFLGPEDRIVTQLGLDQDPRANIASQPGKYRTSSPRIYTAGGKIDFMLLKLPFSL